MITVCKSDFDRQIVPDDCPDVSYLGGYGKQPETEWAIDRKARGDWQHGEFPYWNPSNHVPPGLEANWAHVPNEQIADAIKVHGSREQAIHALDCQHVEEDYQRMESLGSDWSVVGVRAAVELPIPYGKDRIITRIESPGLWGIESDSGEDYFDSVFHEESNILADMLAELGVAVK
jgi:hypothetical protein